MGLSPENRSLLFALAAVLAIAFAFVSSNVAANHHPKPHDLPVGVVGTPPEVGAVTAGLERRAPGAFKITAYGSPAAAQTGILHRKVYGAFDPAPRPLLLVASAASPAAELVLRQTFETATRAQGQTLVTRDLVPLPSSDSSGATSFSAILSLIISAVLGSSLIYVTTQHRSLAVRLTSVFALGIGAGLVAALATNVVVGAFPGHFLGVWSVAALFVLAMALPIAVFQTLFGIRGTAFGLIVFVVIGSPSSGGGTAPELLPGFWRAVSQLLPPGAGTTSMRDVVYFHWHGATRELFVLAAYAALGAAATAIVFKLRARPKPAVAPAGD
jgi:hypothetical protein